MQANFDRAIGRQNYFAASIAAFRRLFHSGSQPNCATGTVVAPPAEDPAKLDRQNIYQDPDPPTPHWGC
jgi:hypothetical protein